MIMPARDIIVVGASAGGVEALIQLCKGLPADLPAAVFIILHTHASSPGLLPKILQRHTSLTVLFGKDGAPFEKGHIYIAPPNRHLLLSDGKTELSSGPQVNLLRPSVDMLFQSAASAYGERVVGVVLSGTRSDGTAGLIAIKNKDGVAIVQDPQEALFSGMPKSALQNIQVDYVLKVEDIAVKLDELVRGSASWEAQPVTNTKKGPIEGAYEVMLENKKDFEQDGNTSPRTVLTCPECGGLIWEVKEGNLFRYVCHVGHAFSEDSLIAGQSTSLESALWVAVRALEERASLFKRLSNRANGQRQDLNARHFMKQSDEANYNADIIRKIILRGNMIDR